MPTQLDAVLKDVLGDLIQGATVSFSYKLATASGFTSAGSAVTDSAGAASVDVDLAAGVYDFMASFQGSQTLLASSVEITYDVGTQAQSQLTESVTPASPSTTDTITVSGLLSANGAGISGAQVDVKLGGTSIGSVTTASDGSYSAQFGPLGPGSYTLAVSFAGDATHLAASHQLSFVVPGAGGLGIVGAAVVVVAAAGVVGTLIVTRNRRKRG